MFDRMIVSDANAVESRGRSRYFLVSGVIVGILFLSAVVVSIYAVDLDLGTENFELSMMIAPVLPEAPEPPSPEPSRDHQSPPHTNDVPTRVHDIPRLEESPTAVPDVVSVTRSPYLARTHTPFKIDSIDSGGPGSIGRPGGSRNGDPAGSSSSPDSSRTAEPAELPDPPPVIKTAPPRPPVSLGVVNGKATSLPKPLYPQPAIAVRAQGEVKVQVTIDESGKVISAKAISGHPLLRREAERAAWKAHFTPTTLSKVPVKVTGMIIYDFRR
ncbi:MAG: energy transducer TonB [Pyrinomonadaceae bacterium]